MKQTIQKIESFLIGQTVWIFLTVLLGASYVCMQMGRILEWKLFLGWFAVWLLLFMPVILFVGFRTQLNDKLSKPLYWTFWAITFIGYPLLCFSLNIDGACFEMLGDLVNHQQGNRFTFLFIAILILLIELLLKTSKKQGNQSKLAEWILKLNVPKLTVIVVAIFAMALTLMSNFFQEKAASLSILELIGWYLYYTVQIFIVYLSYYLYYHIHHYLLFNKLLKEKGLLFYGFGLIALVLILTPLSNQIIAYFPVVHDLKVHSTGLTSSLFDDLNYSIPISVLILSFPLIIIIEWYKQLNTLTVLEKEKSQAELDLLKQQINPHFFFNTLNNLYSMSLTKDKETPETILQLSELMRYVIYKGKEPLVKLSEDLKYIQDYIDLQRIRLHKKIDFHFEKDIEDPGLKIPPLLFIILVENAFKHGIEPAEEKCFLHIRLEQRDGSLIFTCRNSFETETTKAAGIGLENLKRRLEILFPGNFGLNIKKEAPIYKATLKIEL